MAVKQKFNLTATGMQPAGIEREIRLKIYSFKVPEGVQPGEEVTVNFDDAEFVHEQVFHTDQEFATAIEFTTSTARDHVTLYSLEGQDLSELDFSRLCLNGFNFRNCDLSGVDLTGTNVSGCDFTGAKMPKAHMSGITGGALTRSTSNGPTFRYNPASFDEAILDGSNIGDSGLQGTTFRAASMKAVKLDKAILKDSDFSGTDMADATLKETFVTGINFMEAKVTPAQLAEAKGTPLCQPGHYACALKRKGRTFRPA